MPKTKIAEIKVVRPDAIRYYDSFMRLHRDDDKPAIEYTSGGCVWCQHGKVHRGGGLPATVYSDGDAYYYWQGSICTFKEYVSFWKYGI